jgi:hypothetical protein
VVLEVIFVLADAVHPLLAVTITEYVPAAVTVFVADVVPSFHRYVPPPDAVSVMLVVEQFNTPLLGVMDTIGGIKSLNTVAIAIEVHPLLPVTTTE